MNSLESYRLLCAMLSEHLGIGAPRAGPASEAIIDWDCLASLAEAHNLLPCLHPARSSCFPPDFAEVVETAGVANQNRNAIIARQTVSIGRCLNGIGVIPLLLKGGASLLSGLYPRPGQRFIGDIDLLVPIAQLHVSAEALKTAGYQYRSDMQGDARASQHHLWPLVNPHYPVELELHFGVCTAAYESLLPTYLAWQESEHLDVEGVRFRMLSPRLALLHNFIHNQLIDFGFFIGDIRLRRLLEFALLRHKYPDTQIWSWLHRRMESSGHRIAFCNYVHMADELFLGWESKRQSSDCAVQLAGWRTWIHICCPLLTQAWTQAYVISYAVRARHFHLFRRLLYLDWYGRKLKALRLGRRHF
jgi:hypothetical protein